MSKKVLKLAGRRPMLLALIIMATLALGIVFSGWLTPTPSKAQEGGGGGGSNNENTNCVATTNAWSGTCPTVITNGSVIPTNVIVCYSNAPTMPTSIAPVYTPTNIFTQLITYDSTNCETVTNTENITYMVSGAFWTNFSSRYTNFPAHVTNQFSADADVYITSSDTNNCPSPRLVNLATVTWFPIQVSNDAPQYDPDTTNGDVQSMDSCGCGLGDSTIWWFNGESPTGYDVTTTASVTGAPNGATITWTVTGPATTTGSGSSIIIRGTGSSAEHGVSITATVNGTQVCQQFLTVYAPVSLAFLTPAYIDYPLTFGDGKVGYQSNIYYKILDQFGNALPLEVPWNEDIDGDGYFSYGATVTINATPDFTIANGYSANENWTWDDESGGPVNPNKCWDIIARAAKPGTFTPNPEHPAKTPFDEKISHSDGSLYVGSSTVGDGVWMKDVRWQLYIDHGRHL